MGLLLYKSNEMFSATELIRKSKMIFDKIIEDEIDKAIILRDGKPSFLLMDFAKYEKIMAEFEDLKQQLHGQSEPKKIKQKEKKKKAKPPVKVVENIVEKKEEIKEKKVEPIVQEIEKEEIQEELPIDTKPQIVEAKKIENIEEETKIEEEPELSEEEEINNAFLTIEGMNFNDDMKKEAQDKIRIKILQARKERAELLALQEQELQEEDEEEIQLQQHIEEEKLKKERELKEFWD